MLDVINRLMEAAELVIRDITKRLERIEGELSKITKNPEITGKIKAFYYCDLPVSEDEEPLPGRFVHIENVPDDDESVDVLTFFANPDIKMDAANHPDCFRCTNKCDGCACRDRCPLQSPDHGETGAGISSVCTDCFFVRSCYL